MSTLSIHHVALAVENIDDTVKWYNEKLGFVSTFEYNKNGMRFVILQSGNVRLELFSFPDAMEEIPHQSKEVMPDLHVIGTKHLCLQTENLEQTVASLKDKGVEFLTEIDTAAYGGKYIFFKDCNDILVELLEA